jgi:hypothetical protein
MNTGTTGLLDFETEIVEQQVYFFQGMEMKDLVSQVCNEKFNLTLCLLYADQHKKQDVDIKRTICEINLQSKRHGLQMQYQKIENLIEGNKLEPVSAFDFIIHLVRMIRKNHHKDIPRRFLVNYGTWTTLPCEEDKYYHDMLFCMAFDAVEKQIILLPQDSNWEIKSNTFLFQKK